MLFLADSTGKRPAKTFQNNIDFVCFLFASLCKTITGSRERAALDKRYQTTCFPTDHGTADSSDVATCMDHICRLDGAERVGFGSDVEDSECGPDVLHRGQGKCRTCRIMIWKHIRHIPCNQEKGTFMKKSTYYFRKGFKSIVIIYVLLVLLGLIFGVPLNYRMGLAFLLAIIPVVYFCRGGIHRLLEKDREFQALPEAEQNRITADRTIADVTLIDTDEKIELKANPFAAAARGWIGGALGGNTGKWAGIMTTKMRIETKATKATFLVEYESGRSEFETVKIGSLRYKQLMKHM